jgi:hypothetical protein
MLVLGTGGHAFIRFRYPRPRCGARSVGASRPACRNEALLNKARRRSVKRALLKLARATHVQHNATA